MLSSCRNAFLGVAVLSGLVNVLYLCGSLFMLEIYDRVLPSRSVPTLVGLSVILVMLFAFKAFSTSCAAVSCSASGACSTRVWASRSSGSCFWRRSARAG